MNTGVTITTITLTLLIILPLAYMQMQKKKSNNKILNALKELAQQQNSNITTHEVSGDFAIGIDQNSKRLFFYREKEHENVAQNIDLNTIKNCTILKITIKFKANIKNQFGTKCKELNIHLLVYQTVQKKYLT